MALTRFHYCKIYFVSGYSISHKTITLLAPFCKMDKINFMLIEQILKNSQIALLRKKHVIDEYLRHPEKMVHCSTTKYCLLKNCYIFSMSQSLLKAA